MVDDNVEFFMVLDYGIFCGLVFVLGNLIYGLIFNGLKGLYICVGCYYFLNLEVCKLVLMFYSCLLILCDEKVYDQVLDCLCVYGKESGVIWYSM